MHSKVAGKHEILTTIQGWEHWNVIQLGAEKEYAMSRPTFEKLLPEYQKFMGLIAQGHRGLGMFSPEIDKIWHAHILNTYLYEQFCNMICGRMIHHAPNFNKSRVARQSLVSDCSEPGPSCKEPDPGPSCTQDPDPSCTEAFEISVSKDAVSHFRDVYISTYGMLPYDVWNLLSPDGYASVGVLERDT